MNRDRWLVLGSHIPSEGHLGGMVRYTFEMIRSLEARPDIEIHVHCRPEAMPVLGDVAGVDSQRLHPGPSLGAIGDAVRELVGLGSLMESIAPDVVFGSKHLIPLYPAGPDVCRVLTVHDMIPVIRGRDFGRAKRWLLPSMYFRSIRQADVLACVSHAARDQLLDMVPDVEDRTTVVANAMTPSLAAATPHPMDGLTPGDFVLVVGDHSPRKNVAFIVDLWPEVVRHRPRARLVLVGPPGWGTNEAMPGIVPMLADGSVVEAGHVSDGQLRWAYEHASVTLCPSRLEGFGLPVVEALGLGCPVILSTDPAQVEAAAGGGTVVGFDDRAGWVEAIVNHLDRRSVTGAATLQSRTWDDTASELVEVANQAQQRLMVAGRR